MSRPVWTLLQKRPPLAARGGGGGGLSARATILNAHNGYGAEDCVPNLSWSADLATGAQQWASGSTMGIGHKRRDRSEPPHAVSNKTRGTPGTAKSGNMTSTTRSVPTRPSRFSISRKSCGAAAVSSAVRWPHARVRLPMEPTRGGDSWCAAMRRPAISTAESGRARHQCAAALQIASGRDVMP